MSSRSLVTQIETLEQQAEAIERYDVAQLWEQVTGTATDKGTRPAPLCEGDAIQLIQAIRNDRIAQKTVGQRRLELLEQYLTRYRLQSASEDILCIRQRLEHPSYIQKWTELTQTIRESSSSDQRRDAWLDMLQLSNTRERDLLALFEERNARARALGFLHYGEAILSLSGLTAEEFFGHCQALERRIEQVYGAFLNHQVRLTCWDIPYVSRCGMRLTEDDFPGDQLESCLWRLIEDLGFDLRQIQDRIRLNQVRSLPGGLDGLCAILRVPDDIRVATSLGSGYRQYEVLFHEFGHALHKAHVDAPSFTFRWEEPECFNEGMAYTLQFFLTNEEWLRRVLGHTRSRAREIASFLQQIRQVALKYALAQAHFEYRAYESPSSNLHLKWLESYTQHLLVDSDDIAPWGADPALVYQPLWTPSYIVGGMIASQIHGALCNKTFCPDAAEMLVSRCYRPGATLPWREKVRNATGRRLDVTSMVGEICRYDQP